MSSHQISEGTVSGDFPSTPQSTFGSPEKKQLRKPLPTTQQRMLNGTPPTPPDRNQNQYQPEPDMMNAAQMSTLSVNAAPFVPKFTLPPDVQVQDGGQESLYEDFHRLMTIRPAHLNADPATSAYPSLIDLFKNTLFSLTTNPAQLMDLMKPVIEALNETGADDETLKIMVDLLYEQGITEPNFRYTGAKVCQFIGRQMKDSEVYHLFRRHLLTKFKHDYDKREEYIASPDDIPRLCGLTMFLGELFLNMEVAMPDGTVEKMKILRKALRDLILTLLKNPSEPTVICATKCLKLVGACLAENMHLEDPEGSYDEVFSIIHQLDNRTELGATCMCLIKSVINQKDTVWGKNLDFMPPQRPMMTQGPPMGDNQMMWRRF